MIEKIKAVLAEQCSLDADSISETASFKDELYIDSLDLFEMVMTLEQEYNFEIPAEDFDKLTNIKAVADYLTEKGIG